MSIKHIDILNHRKQYVHLPSPTIDTIRGLFGPCIATAWEVFYAESRGTNGVINRTYDYLARKMGRSRKTAIRYVKQMVEMGILIVNHRFVHRSNLCNEFILITPEEALLAAENSPDRKKPDIEIDYSVDFNQSEKPNSVDNPGSFCPPSILDLNQDINNITEATPITGLRQEEVRQNTPKSIPVPVVKRIEKIVKAIPGISNPSALVQEALHFVANRKKGFSEWRAVGAFKKLLGKYGDGPWRTPFGMRYNNEK